MIHPTAQIEDGAIIGEGASIGPYCIIGADVRGYLAECACWNTVLSAGDIAALRAGDNPSTVNASNLAWYAPLRDNATERVSSASGTVNTGATLDVDHPTVDEPPSGGSTPPLHLLRTRQLGAFAL